MRSIKRPRKPVHRYKSLLFPGIALLAVFAFWAAFAPAEKGEIKEFEMDGLRLNITGVHDEGGSLSRFDPQRKTSAPIDTYHVYPGGRVLVLEAPPMEDGTARWELWPSSWGKRPPDQEPLELRGGMDPVRLSEKGDFQIYDRERDIITLLFLVMEPDEDYWK